MNPFDSTLARGRLLFDSFVAIIATAFILLINPILPVLRRLLLLPPFYPHPEPPALPLFSPNSNNKSTTVDWRKLVAGFCFTVGVGFLSVDSHTHFPTPFMLISVLIALTFSFVLVSDFIRIKYPAAARVLEFVGLLSASAALFTAQCIPLTDDLKPVLWSVYAGTVVVIFVINFMSAPSFHHQIPTPDAAEDRKDDLHFIVEIRSNMRGLENSTSSP